VKNLGLQREIIKHVLIQCGITNDNRYNSILRKINSPDLLIDRRVEEQVDGETLSYKVYCSSFKVETSVVNFIACDLSNSGKEFAVIIRMDELIAFGLRYNFDDDSDNGDFMFAESVESWIDANLLLQASLLTGIEKLNGVYGSWSKNNTYGDMFNYLIQFIRAL
jgi:hypothetical protein